MNKKTIRKIYDYFLEDFDKILLNNSKYKKIREKCNKAEDELKGFIGKDSYRKFENFMNEYLYLINIENEEFFVQGFSIANKLRDESLRK